MTPEAVSSTHPKNNTSGKAYREDDIPFLLFSKMPLKNTCRLEVVETAKQYRALLELRNEIFVKQEGYPFSALCNGYERDSVHLLAKVEDRYMGMISVKLDDINGLPIDKYISLSPFSHLRVAEFDKLGVLDTIDEKLQSDVFYQLTGAAYGLVRFCGYNAITMFTLKKKDYNVKMYLKMGFKPLEEFIVFDNELAVAMLLDLDNTRGLVWRTSQLAKLAKRLLVSVNGSNGGSA